MNEKIKRREMVIFISLCFMTIFVFGIIFSIVLKEHTVKADSGIEKGSTLISEGFLIVDSGGILSIETKQKEVSYDACKTNDEMHGVWISLFEFYKGSYTKDEFTKRVDEMFDQCVKHQINTVFVHVRPASDAFYDSDYFPWSKQLTGTFGKDPGYDPLEYMVGAAHKRNLKIHAWINPYRITISGTDMSSFSSNHPAKIWSKSKNSSDRRNVLSYGGKLYYNPSKAAVRKLIVNGVTEIVENYDVDGIHFDDYFYPNLGTDYKKNYDAKEYNAYVKKQKAAKKAYLSIENWRRRNVNLLIKEVYSAVKKADSSVIFGISPAGELGNLYSKCSYYCDVKKWISSKNYVDYICPQIYWSFDHPTAAFDKIAAQWNALPRNKKVKLYVGLALYRAGISKTEAKSINDKGWAKSNKVLMKQVNYLHNKTNATGWVLFRYDNMVSSKAAKEVNNLLKLYKK